jgi:tetratricopeptide (TPR) repeat protein
MLQLRSVPAWALVAFSAGLTCARGEARSAAVPLVVEPAGCAVLRRGPSCELAPDRQLRLWIAGDGEIQARTDQGPLPVGAATPADTGRRHVLTLPAGAAWLEIERSGQAAPARWRLALRSAFQAPRLEQATWLASQRREADAEALLRAALPSLDTDVRGRALSLLGRVALQRGDLPAAIDGLEQGRRIAREVGRLSDWLMDSETLVFVHSFEQHDLARAQRLLDEVAADLRGPGWAPMTARARLAAMTARLAEEAGDLRGALAAMRTAENLDRRLGDTIFARYERGEIARLLATLGRAAEARPILQELVELEARGAGGEPPCNVTAARHNLAWVSALAAQGQQGQQENPGEPGRLFAAAHQAYRDCPNPHLYQHLLIDEALFALDTDDVARARARLNDLRRLLGTETPSAKAAVWLGQIEGRLWLASGRPRQAARAFARTVDRARAASLVERELEARSGLGQALAARGQRRQAVLEFAAAEQILDRLFAGVPLGEGRDVFLASRGQNAQRLVQALVDLGRPSEALAAARRARGRLLRATAFAERVSSLGERDRGRWLAAIGRYRLARARMEEAAAGDWRLSAQELAAANQQRAGLVAEQGSALDQAYQVLAGGGPASTDAGAGPEPGPEPGPGQALVLWFPTDGGWLVFVARADTLVVRRIPADVDDSDKLGGEAARRSLETIARDLEGVERVRLLPPGTLGQVDFHALVVGDRPFGESYVVEYGLDVGRAPAPPPDRARALLVGNPTGDLPAAQAELDLVSRRLGGWEQDIPGPDRATPAALLDLLPKVSLFHYAGHGARAGVEGLGSHLRLAGEQQLLATDVLALGRAPRLVVLSACDSARTAADRADTLGLGQAFVLAGARAVVAPTRPVDDAVALAIVTEFYGKTPRDPAFDPGKALQAAQRSVRQRNPSSDWASFRVLVP